MQCVLLDHRDTVSHYLTGVYLYNLLTQAHQISFSYTYVSFLLLKPLKYLIPPVARLNEQCTIVRLLLPTGLYYYIELANTLYTCKITVT